MKILVGYGIRWMWRLAVLPWLLLLMLMYYGRLCTFMSVSRILALMPGDAGVWARRYWYSHTLSACGRNLHVDWMSAFKTHEARVADDVWIGPSCWMCWVDIGSKVLLGGHVNILSGKEQHMFSCADMPIADQGGELKRITIGSDVWIGNRSVIMADIAQGSVVAAGSVVDKTYDPYTILGGVPAKPINKRGEPSMDALNS